MPNSTIPMTWTNPPKDAPGHSHHIHAYGYDAATKTLALEFNSNHDRLTYHYPNVPPAKFAELEAAPSKGSWFYANKEAYLSTFSRMTKEQEA